MKNNIAGIFLIFFTLQIGSCLAQKNKPSSVALISDTQAPMWVEKLFLKSNHNEEATTKLFEQIVNLKPVSLFILGDVTSWSAKKKKWRTMDNYLQQCRSSGIPVHALLGNHDVMGSVKKGESNFRKRFPDAVTTGYYQIVDSMAFVMLNSNFKKMKWNNIDFQQKWYEETLTSLDKDRSVKAIVISCHHAPYTNSKVVGANKEVQDRFVPRFLSTTKCRLFITGHCHAFEHFRVADKDFLVIGGGGGIHQPLSKERSDLQADFKPPFHFLSLTLMPSHLLVDSYPLNSDFTRIGKERILDLKVD